MPPDDRGGENWRHFEVRASSDRPVGAHDELPFTMVELVKAVKSSKTGKAPGPDKVPVEVVKHWDDRTRVLFLGLINKCWVSGIFPRCWKVSEIKILRKSGDRDWSDPSSYRPICLLPVLGKIYERMIAARLQSCLSGKLSVNQFGFSPGRSTVDAVDKVLEFVNAADTNYVTGLFIDISGAFDGVWWPAVIEKLRRLNVSNSLIRTIRSYLSDRRATLAAGESSVTREVTKGCPQGSVLGPYLWNVIFDDFLNMELPVGACVVAYADDGLILLKANTRQEIEMKFGEITGRMESWAELVKLTYSVSKSHLMNFKAKFSRGRQPVVTLQGQRVRFVQTTMYLGILLDDKLNFVEHAKYVGNKAMTLFGKVLRIARFRYGMQPQTLSIIYDGVFIPIMTYAAKAWAHRASIGTVRTVLRRAQRKVLLGISGAYRTTSFDALTVVTGKAPIDLIVREAPQLWELRNGLTDISKAEIRRQSIVLWQEEWDHSMNGRCTHEELPSVEERLELTWLRPDHHVTQYLTGHGAFASYLVRFRLSVDPTCQCGQNEDGPQHVTFTCADLEDERQVLIQAVRDGGAQWPCSIALLLRNERLYRAWRSFLVSSKGKRNV